MEVKHIEDLRRELEGRLKQQIERCQKCSIRSGGELGEQEQRQICEGLCPVSGICICELYNRMLYPIHLEGAPT